jgi:trigger factor
MSRTMQKRELFDELEKKCDFDAPEQMVDMEFQSIWAQVERNMQTDPELKKKSKEKLEKEYKKMAERRVKLGILLSETGSKNNITANDQEVSKAILAKAQQFPGQEKRVFEYYQGNPEAVEDLKGPILEEKVVDFILSKVELKEKKIGADEFIKKIEKMNEESEIA